LFRAVLELRDLQLVLGQLGRGRRR
jgi:hypothetical protein